MAGGLHSGRGPVTCEPLPGGPATLASPSFTHAVLDLIHHLCYNTTKMKALNITTTEGLAPAPLLEGGGGAAGETHYSR